MPFSQQLSLNSSSTLVEWAQPSTKGILWITGFPGSGKSVLIRQAFNDCVLTDILRSTAQDNALLKLAFAFQAGRKDQSTPADMLRSLIYQILTKKPELASEALRSDDALHGNRWSARAASGAELLSSFEAVVKSAQHTFFAIFIDALDECHSDPGLSLEDFVTAIANLPQRCPHVKICLSSRPWNVLLDKFYREPRLTMQDVNAEDIKRYVKTKLQNTSIRKQQMSDISKAVLKNAGGSFVWVRIVLENITKLMRDGTASRNIQKVLEKTPVALSEMYEDMLRRIPLRYRHEGWAILRMVLLLNSTVDVSTLKCAIENRDALIGDNFNLASNPEIMPVDRFDSDDEEKEWLERVINSRCGGLLQITNEGNLAFIHGTVTEFLQRSKTYTAMERAGDSFKPYATLLASSVLRLERYQAVWSSDVLDSYAPTVLNLAKLVDGESGRDEAYVWWFERFCRIFHRTFQELVSRRRGPPADESASCLSGEASQSASGSSFAESFDERFSLFIAAKLGLIRYVKLRLQGVKDVEVEAQATVSRLIGSVDSLLNVRLVTNILDFQAVDGVPWDASLPSLCDLPDPDIVALLVPPEPDSHGKGYAPDAWRNLLRAGYHSFGRDIPHGAGPQNTPESQQRWVRIMAYFLRAGADAEAQYLIEFQVKAGSENASMTGVEVHQDIEERWITPDLAIGENLLEGGDYDDKRIELLGLLQERRRAQKVFTPRTGRFEFLSSHLLGASWTSWSNA